MIEFFALLSDWAVPLFILAILSYGLKRGIPIYEAFTEGGKEGFTTAVEIIPYLVAMLVAIEVLKVSGGIDLIQQLISPLTGLLGIPSEIIPLALMRPLSGGGSQALLLDLFEQYGPDSYLGRLGSALFGSTETTFYVITLYYGAIGVKRVRHSLFVGLLADLAGILAAVFFTGLIF